MHTIRWDEGLALGVAEMDDDHRVIVGIMNDLIAALHTPSNQWAVVAKARDLALFTARHFAHEERSMAAHRYPGFGSHQREHDVLLTQFDHVSGRLAAEGLAVVDDDLMAFLHGWVVKHITSQDRAYAAFLKAGRTATLKP